MKGLWQWRSMEPFRGRACQSPSSGRFGRSAATARGAGSKLDCCAPRPASCFSCCSSLHAITAVDSAQTCRGSYLLVAHCWPFQHRLGLRKWRQLIPRKAHDFETHIELGLTFSANLSSRPSVASPAGLTHAAGAAASP